MSPKLQILAAQTASDVQPGSIILFVAVVALAALLVAKLVTTAMKRLLFVCRPNELLVVSGRKQTLPSGTTVNFTVVSSGRLWRVPFLQDVKRMDLRLIPIEIAVKKVLSQGNIPLDIHAMANVKITSDPGFVHNAAERFLDLPPDNIQTAARQTLEGMIRGIIATMTPEQVNEDRIGFAERLLEQTLVDFSKMGLHLDTLKILRVEDEAKYLVNLGRTQIANAIRDAENAENQANQEIAQEEAKARQAAEVATKDAQIGVATQRNQLRALSGQLEGKAQSVEREAAVAAEQARWEAEQELQAVRATMEQKRLLVEVVLPAEARAKAAALIAEGDAAPRREQGNATAEVIRAMADAVAAAGPEAREMFVLAQLDTLVGQIAARVRTMQIGNAQVVDSGDGRALPALAASYPAAVVEVLGTLRDITGVDVPAMLARKGGTT